MKKSDEKYKLSDILIQQYPELKNYLTKNGRLNKNKKIKILQYITDKDDRNEFIKIFNIKGVKINELLTDTDSNSDELSEDKLNELLEGEDNKEKLQDLVEKGDILNNQNSNTENTEMEITENKNDTIDNSDIKENIKMDLYNEDCLVKMKDIQNKSIDMILCDLPYGCTKNKWDIIIPFDKLWLEYNRIIKNNGAIVLFGSQPFTSLLIVSNLKMFRYCLVWEKNKFSDFLNAKRKPMKTNEDICIFYKKQPTYNPQFTYGDPYKRWNTQKTVDKQTYYGRCIYFNYEL